MLINTNYFGDGNFNMEKRSLFHKNKLSISIRVLPHYCFIRNCQEKSFSFCIEDYFLLLVQISNKYMNEKINNRLFSSYIDLKFNSNLERLRV